MQSKLTCLKIFPALVERFLASQLIHYEHSQPGFLDDLEAKDLQQTMKTERIRFGEVIERDSVILTEFSDFRFEVSRDWKTHSSFSQHLKKDF